MASQTATTVLTADDSSQQDSAEMSLSHAVAGPKPATVPAGKPLKQRVGHDLTECMERGSVRVRITQLRFDVHLQHGQARKSDDKEVVKRLASLKQNPPTKLVAILAWQDEGT